MLANVTQGKKMKSKLQSLTIEQQKKTIDSGVNNSIWEYCPNEKLRGSNKKNRREFNCG